MPTAREIATFHDGPPPGAASPWVVQPAREPIDMVPADPAWPVVFEEIAAGLREVLGARVLDLLHVGSTSVPGLAAKPVIDIDLIVANPANEPSWLPALEAAGFVLTAREPWWHEHRMLRGYDPRSNIHIFGPDAAEPWKHRIFRDHLLRDHTDRDRYARAKQDAARLASAEYETVMEYNRRKEEVIRAIYARAFAAAALA